MCNIKLPSFFSNGMVVGKNARIWGWGQPGQSVNVQFLGVSYNAVCDSGGRFDVTVVANEFGGPHIMTIGGQIINDVYVGRVWFCGGQSNMETPISRTRELLGKHITEDTRIRVFQAEKGVKFDGPATDVNGKWQPATESVLDQLYAVPYFFARQLLEDDSTPIGLLCTPAGGTPMQGWLTENIIENFPVYYQELLRVKEPNYIEQVTAEGNARVHAWHEELLAGDVGLAEGWQHPDYDDRNWQNRMLLDTAGLPEHGAVWYRKRITLPKVTGTVTLNLGRVINSVKVYVNGQQVCGVDYMYPPCVCVLPEGLLKEGENLIAVRVVGDGNTPEFVPGKDYSLTYVGGKIDLSGMWKFNIGKEMPNVVGGGWFYGHPCGVYNYMLAPLLGYSVDGMIWYQGESNIANPETYKVLFTEFVRHVRQYFGENLKVIFTQLANFADPRGIPGDGWAVLREEQRKCLEIPNTAMAVAIDCGEWNDIHPIDKKTVGDRLALHARKLVYGQDVVADGPVAVKAASQDGILAVSFDYGVGLWARGGYPLLDVVDTDGAVHRLYAAARDEKLVARLGRIKPAAVRFGWTDCPAVTLYNAYNLPASPFQLEVQ
ncbi:MAG: beta galactosidase jelly roll domain-containing protein [Firmicutes bacterium]|nr:beta galactosidase jelly roll domain-containing protein [Bacillota bacterium]